MSVIDKYHNSESHKLDAGSFRKRLRKHAKRLMAAGQRPVRVEPARKQP